MTSPLGATALAEALWRSEGAALHRTLSAVLGSADEAEEVLAEAFARAIAKWDRNGVPDNPAGWLQVVAVNVARSRWRRAKTAASFNRLLSHEAVAQPGPERVAVWDALRRLPFPQREALALFYLGDMSVEEVAAITNSPTGTVKARLARGRAALTDYFDDEQTVAVEQRRRVTPNV